MLLRAAAAAVLAAAPAAARLVVQAAQDAHSILVFLVSSMMPITMVWESFVAGAEETTCLAPAFGCGCTFTVMRKAPVDSQT